MSTTLSTLSPAEAGSPRASAGPLRRLLDGVRDYMQHRRDVAIMMEMDERLLRDAGLTRYDLEKGFYR